MNKSLTLLATCFILLIELEATVHKLNLEPESLDPQNTTWFTTVANDYMQSCPLGNGRVGAMVFGGVGKERIVLNESSMWSGSRQDADRPDAFKWLSEIRKLLLEGKNAEAQELMENHFNCQGEGSGKGKGANFPFGCYQVFGNLHLDFGDAGNKPATDYVRSLDLRTATASVSYKQNGVRYLRTHFVSAPDEVFVSRLTADRKGAISFSIALDRPERFATSAVAENELLITGSLNNGYGGRGTTYAGRLRVLASGGTVSAVGDRLFVKDADEVILHFTAATDYRGFAGRQLWDPVGTTRHDLDRLAGRSYDDLYLTHLADYSRYYERVDLQLPITANSALSTPERIAVYEEDGEDPALAALFFNFGRYMLISSSRPGGLPGNLQGIWGDEIQTPWNGDWHLDVNVQMNYWPVQVCNLSELQEPLNKLIESLMEPGSKTAKSYYAAQGWVAHCNATPWDYTSPGLGVAYGSTTTGSAWLCEHLWTQYAYTGDRKFLEWAYPIMKGAALFYLDILIEEPENQWLVTAPSISPENAFRLPNGKRVNVCLGSTYDMQLLRELFANCIQAAEILGIDGDLQKTLRDTRHRLAPNQIGPDGRLQEWLEPYDEASPQHRHLSHLYGMFPYHEITPSGTSKLARAVVASLEGRGDGGTGWSKAWKVNLWARLLDEERAHKLLKSLIGECYDNLFSYCPPFVADANFGGTSGIAEMLLQSHPDTGAVGAEPVISLLPALPKAWPAGKVTGLGARGGLTVDLHWENGQLSKAILRSDRDETVSVRYAGKNVSIPVKPHQDFTLDRNLQALRKKINFVPDNSFRELQNDSNE